VSLEEDYDDEVAALFRKHAVNVQGYLIGSNCSS